MDMPDTAVFEGGQARIAGDFGDPADPHSLVQVAFTELTLHRNKIAMRLRYALHYKPDGTQHLITCPKVTLITEINSHFMVGDKLIVVCAGGMRIELLPPGHSDCIEFPDSTPTTQAAHRQQAE